MADKTTRELIEATSPADTNLLATWPVASGQEPTKTAVSDFRAALLAILDGSVVRLLDSEPALLTHSIAGPLDLSGVVANYVQVTVDANIDTSVTPPSADPGTGTLRSVVVDLIIGSGGPYTVSGLDGDADVTLDGTIIPVVDTAVGASTTLLYEGNSAGAWTLYGLPVIALAQIQAALTASTTAKRAATVEINRTTDLTVADGQAYLVIPPVVNGMNLTAARLVRASGTGTAEVQIHRIRGTVDMLTTRATTSTPGAVDTNNDDVLTDDLLRIDVDVAGTNTQFAVLVLEFTP